jgi:hypothetical protein
MPIRIRRHPARGGHHRHDANAGAVAFSRCDDPNLGEFEDALILKTFGEVPEDFR